MMDNPILDIPSISIAVFAIPKTVPLSYEKTFTKVDDLTAIQLKRISDSRQEVVVASERAFSDAAIKGVEKYLPELFGLMQACEGMPPDFTKHLHIDWSSSLGTQYTGTSTFRHTNWYWESINVLHCYGLLHRRLARDVLVSIPEDQFSNRWMEVTKLLSIAAGIFEYISQSVASKFFVFPKDMPLPEIFPETFSMLQRLCLAEAQELVVKRAIIKENNPSMAAQLCAAAAQEFEMCYSIADKIQIPEKPNSHLIKASTRTYLQWKGFLWRGQANKLMAESHIWKHEPGYALAYLEKACAAIKQATYDIKILDSNTDILWEQYDNESKKIQELYQSTEKDNDNIYHEVIRRDSIVPIEPKLLAKTTPFTSPAPAEVSINKKDLAGLSICCIQ